MSTQIARIAHKTVRLTNAQIKALPTTGVTLVPAPGRGKTLHFLYGQISVDRAGGAAYTNLTNGVHLDLMVGTQVVATPILNLAAESKTQVTDLFAGTTVAMLAPFAASSASLGGPLAVVGTSLAVRNAALTIKAVGNTGDFTGGHADSTMTVTVYYSVLVKTVSDAVAAPASAQLQLSGQMLTGRRTFRVYPLVGAVTVTGQATATVP